MARTVIQKAITTEKSFKNQDKGLWTFLVSRDANKIEIKKEIEQLFGVEVESVNTRIQRAKIRQLRGSRVHTKRNLSKVAQISLKEKSKKIDLTKLNK
ncbi:MAG: 50S ribosomal protein L23 [Candidatus Altimarinota bacterium]